MKRRVKERKIFSFFFPALSSVSTDPVCRKCGSAKRCAFEHFRLIFSSINFLNLYMNIVGTKALPWENRAAGGCCSEMCSNKTQLRNITTKKRNNNTSRNSSSSSESAQKVAANKCQNDYHHRFLSDERITFWVWAPSSSFPSSSSSSSLFASSLSRHQLLSFRRRYKTKRISLGHRSIYTRDDFEERKKNCT